MKNFKILQYIIIFILITNLYSQDTLQQEKQKQDTLSPPIIDIRPSNITVEHPDGKFITKYVKVLNRGGEPLFINKINSSCQCASSTILSSKVYPLEIGKIILYVNLDGFDKEHNFVEYLVESNAKNSPTSIKIKVLLPQDSLKIEKK